MLQKIKKLITTKSDNEVPEFPEADDGIPRVPEDRLIGVYPRDSAWGNKIVFDDYEQREVYGWKRVSGDNAKYVSSGRPVQDGDLFGYQMESGLTAVFMLANVDNMRDPKDMFFADCIDVGYMKEDS